MGRSEALYFGDSLELTLTSVIGSRKIIAGRIIITTEPGVSWGGLYGQCVVAALVLSVLRKFTVSILGIV